MTEVPAPLPLGAEDFGFPHCQECGYPWSTSFEAAVGHVAGAPARCAELVTGHPLARRKPTETTWSPSGYVWHMSDWFRIQGQRIFAIGHDREYVHVPLGADPDSLAEVHHYDELSVPGGLWALERAAELFVAATDGIDARLVFRHPNGNEWTVHELVVYVGHEAVHHEMDIRRGLDQMG